MKVKNINSARKAHGFALTEFAPSFMLFLLFGLLPLFCCLIVPLRFCLAQSLMDQAVRDLARCEKMSIACSKFRDDTNWEHFLSSCGLKIKEKNISVLVSARDLSNFALSEPAHLDSDWLPGGSKDARTFTLELSASYEMAPLFRDCKLSIPGLTSPLSMRMKSEHLWENMSCDPETRQFYINE